MATKSHDTTDEQRDRLQHIHDNDEQALDDLIAIRVEEAVDASDLDAKMFAMVNIAALIASGGDDASYLLHVTAALDAGASVDEITGVLTAVGPNIAASSRWWPRPTRWRRRSASTSSRPVATAATSSGHGRSQPLAQGVSRGAGVTASRAVPAADGSRGHRVAERRRSTRWRGQPGPAQRGRPGRRTRPSGSRRAVRR